MPAPVLVPELEETMRSRQRYGSGRSSGRAWSATKQSKVLSPVVVVVVVEEEACVLAPAGAGGGAAYDAMSFVHIVLSPEVAQLLDGGQQFPSPQSWNQAGQEPWTFWTGGVNPYCDMLRWAASAERA